MRRVVRGMIDSYIIRMVVVASAIYWLAAWVLPQDDVNVVLSSLSLCLATGVMFMYAPMAADSLLHRRLNSADRLVWGIIFSWGARVVLSGVAVVNLLTSGIIFNETAFFGYVFMIVLLAAVMHITAPMIGTLQHERRDWKSVMVAVAAGAMLAGFIIGLGIGTLGAK